MKNTQFKIRAVEYTYIKPSKKKGYVYTGNKGNDILNEYVFPHHRQAVKFLKNYWKENGIKVKKHECFKSMWKYEVCKDRVKTIYSFSIEGNVY